MVKSFLNEEWSGYVHNVILIGGELYDLSDEQLEYLLTEYYGLDTVVSDDEAYGWQGSPSEWEYIIKSPSADDEWWEGRLSLEEGSLTERDNTSGRQPKLIKSSSDITELLEISE